MSYLNPVVVIGCQSHLPECNWLQVMLTWVWLLWLVCSLTHLSLQKNELKTVPRQLCSPECDSCDWCTVLLTWVWLMWLVYSLAHLSLQKNELKMVPRQLCSPECDCCDWCIVLLTWVYRRTSSRWCHVCCQLTAGSSRCLMYRWASSRGTEDTAHVSRAVDRVAALYSCMVSAGTRSWTWHLMWQSVTVVTSSMLLLLLLLMLVSQQLIMVCVVLLLGWYCPLDFNMSVVQYGKVGKVNVICIAPSSWTHL